MPTRKNVSQICDTSCITFCVARGLLMGSLGSLLKNAWKRKARSNGKKISNVPLRNEKEEEEYFYIWR